jgi:hypothetical protein
MLKRRGFLKNSGALALAGIFAQAKTAGMKHFFVEHDMPSDPFTSITMSFNNLSKIVLSP